MNKKNVLSLPEIVGKLAPGQRLMGLDLGTKTIGLAISDSGLVIASPLTTIRRKKFTGDAQILVNLCTDHEIGGFVIGLPLNMNGTEGPQAQSTRSFVENFEKISKIPFSFWDERLSTMAVTRTLLEADASPAKRSNVVDKMAATYILQGALDSLVNTLD